MIRRPLPKTLPWFILAAVLAVGWARPLTSGPNNNAVDLLEMSDSLGDLAETVSKGTVLLSVAKTEGNQLGRGLGTGFVVDALRGIIVTNAHVVEGAETAKVHFSDGREVKGTVLGRDVQTDLAVIDIPPGSARHQLPWGDSDVLRPGNLVMAVGSPLGLEGTTSLGVVSALGRSLEMVDDAYEDFIQFDAFIDRGSSGGPLVNMAGEVIGINAAIGGGSGGGEPMWRGIGYAIPTAIARRYVDNLAEHGEVMRGWLGITAQGLTPSRARLLGLDHTYGVEIIRLVEEGPAAKAGLKKGDVILTIEGREVSSSSQVRARIAALEPGTEVKVKILSRRAQKVLRIELGTSPG
jgi:S1-C subfamily serine protease